jgi:hypothetical protein
MIMSTERQQLTDESERVNMLLKMAREENLRLKEAQKTKPRPYATKLELKILKSQIGVYESTVEQKTRRHSDLMNKIFRCWQRKLTCSLNFFFLIMDINVIDLKCVPGIDTMAGGPQDLKELKETLQAMLASNNDAPQAPVKASRR